MGVGVWMWMLMWVLCMWVGDVVGSGGGGVDVDLGFMYGVGDVGGGGVVDVDVDVGLCMWVGDVGGGGWGGGGFACLYVCVCVHVFLHKLCSYVQWNMPHCGIMRFDDWVSYKFLCV